jgi:uncharacterized phiE125 gp8 family phage protein
MAAKIITQPGLEPLTLAEVKLHCRVDGAEQDTLVALYLTAAREHCENVTGARCITQTWELALDRFPCGAFQLPGYPLQSVETIEYLDANGDPQAVDPADLVIDTFQKPGSVSSSLPWPETQDTINAVRVTYKLGFGDDPTDVPSGLRAAILLHAGDLSENRQGQQKDALNANPAVDNLLFPFRLLTP